MLASGGATPLMYACQQCRETEVLDILKKQPNSVKERDRTLKTPLHYCAENPNSSCAEAVLKAAPELVNAQDENGYCTLHLAVIAGNKSLIKLLIGRGADVNIYDNEGHSAVHWAIVSSEKEALEMIIRAGADPSTPDIHGGYPLHYAVQMCGCNCDYVRNFEDTLRVVETLLSLGVDVSVKDKDGRQPILWAASAGSADAVIHLVSGGACVEAADKDGLTALHCAASRGHTTTLETLITLCGANVDVIDGNGCSALFYSVTLGHADATELLLQLGAEPNRQDRKGRTPAHCGAAKGQLETLRILQKHGGNLWMRNVKGDIPLHEAVASGRKDLVLWLLSQCSEAINIANNDGRCPLHIASMYNNTEMVKVLLDCKSLVNPVMRTSKGVLMTPLNVALSKGHRSCGKYLQLHGGVPFSKVSKVEPVSEFALRVSPSDDTVVIVSENNKENVTPSQIIISRSRSSTDLQENREVVKTETGDKKKVYRRRKKKKNTSNIHTQDSDSEDSASDLKVKTPESRKSERSSGGSAGNHENENAKSLKVQVDTKKTGKNQTNLTVDAKKVSVGQTEVSEEVTKTDSKSLQRNKSFNETKNVSDLSPEDFPPLMQTVSHLDIVIMEPDADERSKPESENEMKIVVGTEVVNAVETKEGGEATVQAKTAPNVSEEKNVVEKHAEEVDEKIVKEEAPLQEKSGDASGVKKSNGAGRKSSEEGPGRKSMRSPKSSSDGGSNKKDTKKKTNGGADGSDRRKKTGSPKESKTDRKEEKPSDTKLPDEEVEKPVSVETKALDEAQQEEEKLKTEPEVVAVVSTDKTESNAEQTIANTTEMSETVSVDSKTNAELKSSEVAARILDPVVLKEESSAVLTESVVLASEIEGRKPSETETSAEGGMIEKEVSAKGATTEKETSAKGAITERETSAKGAATEKEVSAKGATAEKEASAKGATTERETSAKGRMTEKETSAKGKMTEKETSTKGATTEKEASAKGATTERETSAKGKMTEKETSAKGATTEKEASTKEVTTGKEPSAAKANEPKPEALNEIKVPETKIDVPPQENAKPEEKNEKPKMSLPEITVIENTSENENFDASNTESTTATEKPVKEVLSKSTEKLSVEVNQPILEKSEEKRTDAENKDAVIVSGSNSINSGDVSGNLEEPNLTPREDVPSGEAKNGEVCSEGDVDTQDGSSPKKAHFTEGRQFRTPRVSRLCRRNRDFKDDMNQISVTQLVQNTIRKYHMERGIFYQLLELKRYQIRSGKANEQVLVKRLADEYERSRVFLGMKPFTGLYKFREFEKFLYDQLKALNSRRSFIIPEVKSYDDIDALSGFLKKSRYKIISETPPPEMVCTCITQRCHHSACAYTNVPCSAYITDLRRHRHERPRKESFFPRIEQKSETQKQKERPATLELIQGSEKHVITLPQNSPAGEKRYYVTFTIKGAPAFKEGDFDDDSKDYFKHRHAKSV